MRQRSWTEKDLSEAVIQSQSLAQVLRYLNLAIAGGSYAHIRAHIKRLGLDTSHFSGQSGRGRFGKSKNLELTDILVDGSPYQSSEIRRFVIKANLKNNRWQEKPITIQLHHINGKRNDHRLSNLRMLCPNCHTQQ